MKNLINTLIKVCTEAIICFGKTKFQEYMQVFKAVGSLPDDVNNSCTCTQPAAVWLV